MGRGGTEGGLLVERVVADCFLHVEGLNVVLEGAGSFPVGHVFASFLLLFLLLFLQQLVVNSPQVVVVELNMGQFGPEDVHLAAVLEDNLVIEVDKCLLGFWDAAILYKGLPDFGLFEYEYLNDGAIGAEELIEMVMGDDVAVLVVDTDQQHWSFRTAFLVTPHHVLN